MQKLLNRLSVAKTVFIAALGLFILAISNKPFEIPSQPLLSETFAKETQLTCEEIVQVTKWGGKHYGGPKRPALHKPQVAEKFLNVFLEKLDPNKLLFLDVEAKDFVTGGMKHWSDLVSRGSCAYYDAWVRAHYPIAKKRVLELSALLPFNKIFKLSASKESVENYRLAKFSAFAATPRELTKRLEQAAEVVAKNTSKEVVEAYRSDKKRLFLESLNENLFENVAAPSTLVAKALLGTMDPYSTYFSKTEYEDFYSDLSAGTTGIGIRVQKVPQGFLIEKVVKNSSAADSKKVHEGDVITAIDGMKTENSTMQMARQLLKGDANTVVNLELTNLKTSETKNVALTRKHFEFEESRIKQKSKSEVAVIEIPNFYGKTSFEADQGENSSALDLKKALQDLAMKPNKAKGVVLDLRGNPGGFLEEAVSMAGMFVGNKPVVGVVEQAKTRVMLDETAEAIYQGPLVVLVDEGTASAGEVLAGALKDLQRAVVVGSTKTYGKGSVQKLFQLDEDLLQVGLKHPNGNGVLKLTTSLFYSPLGHSPANGGIESDIKFPSSIRRDSGNDYGHSFSMDVPEINPIVDDITLSELKLKEQINQQTLDLLRGKSLERTQSVQGELTDDPELDEAVSIATDLSFTFRKEL